MLKDVRLALRRLRKNPLFAGIGIATLALGIGANVAIFSLLYGIVLRPLPYESPERLVTVWPAQNHNKALAESYAGSGTLARVAGISNWSIPMVGEGEPEEVPAGVVGLDYFEVLGVRAALGRTFVPEERDPSRSAVVVLSHGFWQRRFGGDPAVVGRVLPLDGYDHTARRVIGVLPPDFRPVWGEADIFVPLHQPPGRTVATDSSWYVNVVVARLAPGATLEQASAEVAGLAGRMKREHPGLFMDEAVAAAGVQPLQDFVVGPARSTLWILLGAVGLVLLIACANVANMLLARGSGRSGEVALRKALGATADRLVAEGVVESVVLAALGGVAGLALAVGFMELAGPEIARRLPRSGTLEISAGVLVFALGVTLLAAALFGLLPAIRSAGRDAAEGLRGAARGGTVRSTHRLNRALVTAEIALAVVLVSAAALMTNSFLRLVTTDPGFEADGVLAASIAPPQTRYDGDAAGVYYRQVLDAVEAVPGIGEAGAVHLLPLTLNNWSFPYLAEGYEARPDQPLPAANFRVVTPAYFDVLGIPLLRGRLLTETDVEGGEPVGLVNQAFVDERWPGEDAVGREVRLFGSLPFTVVGVVGDIRQHALDQPTRPEMYRPLAQYPLTSMIVMARADRPEAAAALVAAVRAAIWSVDPNVPIRDIRPLSDVRDDSVARARLLAWLLAGFAGLALLLGAIGVYGVMAYIASSRLREFGIRAALGAGPLAVQSTALRWGLAPVAVGLLAGVAATLAVGRVMTSLLFEVEPGDPWTLAGVTLALGLVAAVATWIPARRASRVDPVRVLGRE